MKTRALPVLLALATIAAPAGVCAQAADAAAADDPQAAALEAVGIADTPAEDDANPLGEGAPPRALQRYEAGIEAFRKRSFEESAREFMAALKLAPTAARAAKGAGRAWEQAGAAAAAIRHYELYMDLSPMSADQAEIEAAIARLRPLAEQQKTPLSVVTRPAGATLFLDGAGDTPLGPTPVQTKVDPGEHLLLTRLKGFEPDRRTIVVTQGHPLTISLELTRPGQDADEQAGLDWKVPTGFGLLGVGLAGLAVGIYSGVSAGATADRIKALDAGSRADYDRLKDDFQTQDLWRTVGLSGGIAGVVTGAGLLVWHNLSPRTAPALGPPPAQGALGAGLIFGL